jgi:hypothetical protein
MEISHAQMNEALGARAAVPLGPGLRWVVRYLGAWWVEYENGWLRITDDDVTADLDDVAVRLREASTIAATEEARHGGGPNAAGGGWLTGSAGLDSEPASARARQERLPAFSLDWYALLSAIA